MATALGTALNRMSIEIDAESERLKQKKKDNGAKVDASKRQRRTNSVGGSRGWRRGRQRGGPRGGEMAKGHQRSSLGHPSSLPTHGRQKRKKKTSSPPPPRSSFPPLRRIPFRAFCLFFANSSAGPHFCQGAFRLSVVFVRYSPLGRMAIVFFRGSTEESRKNKKNARNRPFTISRDPLLIAGR